MFRGEGGRDDTKKNITQKKEKQNQTKEPFMGEQQSQSNK